MKTRLAGAILGAALAAPWAASAAWLSAVRGRAICDIFEDE